MNVFIIVILAGSFLAMFAILVYALKTGDKEPLKTILNSETPPPQKRRQVKDVEAGELVQIEWYRIAGGIGYGKCINNDPLTNKILLEFTWNNYKQMKTQEKERVVFDYKDKELANFTLLNPEPVYPYKPKKQESQEQEQSIDTPAKSVLKSVYCNYRGHLIVHDVHGQKVQELSGEMTLEKCNEIESRSQEGITEIEGSIDVYNRISKELKKE